MRRPTAERRQIDARLLSFESVKRWLGSETIRSKNTRDCYLYHFGLLLDHLKVTPDEFMAERIKDMSEQDYIARTRMELKVRGFKTELEATKGKYTAFQMVAAACSFLKANTGARLNINNPPPEAQRDVFEYEGDPAGEQGFWRNIVDHAPTIRDAVAFLIGLEAGPRDGSLLRMTVADVTQEFRVGAPREFQAMPSGAVDSPRGAPYKITVPPPGESHVKKRGGFNFIAEDAKARIETYLSLRRRRFGDYQPSDLFLIDLETGQPLRYFDCINDALRKAFLDAGALSHDQVYPPDVRMSPVRWYCLRKRAETILEDNRDGSGIALNWVDVLLSHKPRGAQASHYSRPTVPLLRDAYAKAMHRIMIYRETRREMSDDEFMTKFNKAWAMLGDKMAREAEKIQSQTISGRQMARILRELMTVSKEAE